VRRVTLRASRRGLFDGALIGGIGAAAAGVLFGALGGDKPEPCDVGCSAASRMPLYGVLGAVGGALFGGAIGYAAGAREERPVDAATPPK
jgi:hypothetical protein